MARRRPRQRRRLGRRQERAALAGVPALLVSIALILNPAGAFVLPSSSPPPPWVPLRCPQQQQQQLWPAIVCPPSYHRRGLRSLGSSHEGSSDDDPESFSSLYKGRLPPWLLARTEALGFHRPTAVQRAALRPILDEEDVIVHAQTGTGKTLAFLLPLLAGIDPNKRAVQALVVVPSRELGLQVASVCKRLAAGRAVCRDEGEEDAEEDGDEGVQEEEDAAEEEEGGQQQQQQEQEQEQGPSKGDRRILIMSLLEGSKNRRQRAWARAEPPHVVIGNPRALSRLVEQGGIRYHQVRLVVVDEVDACLVNRETRAELQGLLGKYLSPSYLTAALEEEEARSSEEAAEAAASVPQGAMREGGGKRQQQLAPWRLARRQTVFCSATIPQHNHFIRQCLQQQWTLREPVHVQVTPGELVPPHLRHGYLACPTKAQKLRALRAFLRREAGRGRLEAAVVFAADEEEARAVVEALSPSSLPGLGGEGPTEAEEEEEEGKGKGKGKEAAVAPVALFLTSRDNIRVRAQVMEGFREGRAPVLVTTDFAARGLDVPRVSHVVMYDVPADAETYLHRGGRAGRMGRPGTVASLVSEAEAFALLRLANTLNIEVARFGALKKKRKSRRQATTTREKEEEEEEEEEE